MSRKEQYQKIYREQLDILIHKMDKRDNFYRLLEEWKLKYGEVPVSYLGDWVAYTSDSRYLNNGKTWRDVKGVFKTIKKAAHITALKILQGVNNDNSESEKN